MLRQKKRLVQRYPGNPILTGEDFPKDIVTVFNCGVVKQGPRKYTMVCRCEDSSLGRYMWVADSEDGIRFKPRPEPVKLPVDDPVFKEYVADTWSYYDPRVTPLEGRFYITHAAHTSHGCQLGLFVTDGDFEKFDWLGLISWPDNRNGVLFPRKINGMYWRLDRPNVERAMDVFTGQSPDLLHWGSPRCIIRQKDIHWGYTKIGPGAPPIETPEGWLCILHGVRIQCAAHYVYQLGVALLDREDPNKVLGVAQRAILWPEETYELIGQTPSVVFTNGAILEDDGEVRIYYGAADTVQCLGTARLDELIYACRHE